MTQSGWIWIAVIVIVLIVGAVWITNMNNSQSLNQPTTGVGTYPTTDTNQPLEGTPATGGALGTVPPQASGSPMTTTPTVTPDQGAAGANTY